MKTVPLILAALLCFGAGWWLDGLWGREAKTPPGVMAKVPPLTGPGVATEETGRAEKTLTENSGQEAGAQPAVMTAEELLKLYVPGEETASNVRLAKALVTTTQAQLRALANELRAMAEKGKSLGDDAFEMVVTAVAQRWLALEPEPALEFSLAIGMLDPEEALLEAMQKVFASDFEKAVRLMNTELIGGGFIDRGLYIDIRSQWIESLKGTPAPKALERIVDFDARTKNECMGADSLGDFPAEWIGQDPTAAMAWALALPPAHNRRKALEFMALAWGRKDAAAARNYVNALPAGTLPAGALKNMMLHAIGPGETLTPPATE